MTKLTQKAKNSMINELEKRYNKLEQYVLDNEHIKNCNRELKRMNEILDKIAYVQFKM